MPGIDDQSSPCRSSVSHALSPQHLEPLHEHLVEFCEGGSTMIRSRIFRLGLDVVVLHSFLESLHVHLDCCMLIGFFEDSVTIVGVSDNHALLKVVRSVGALDFTS